MTIKRFIKLIPNKFYFTKTFNLFKYLIAKKYRLIQSVNYLPISLDVEPTTGCNFKCTMCQVSSENFLANNMEMATFKKLIRDNPQLIKIKLQGMGEPLFHKGLIEMVEYASSYGIASDVTTNGSLLTKKAIDHFLKNKLSRIIVSIDGATPETFEAIRVSSNFQRVVKQCKLLIDTNRKKFFKTEIQAWCVVQKQNFNEMIDILKLCQEIGFDSLTYQLTLSGWGKEEWEDANNDKQVVLQDSSVKETMQKAKEYAKKNNYKIKFYTDNSLSFKKPCQWPSTSAYISTDGSVVPCCFIADPTIVNFGNIKDKNFSSIWTSKEYVDFRRSIESNQLRDYCKNCYEEYSHKN